MKLVAELLVVALTLNLISIKHLDMKNFILFTLIAAGSFIGKPASAQVNVNINIGAQPVWGPVGYDYVEYYYMPGIESYYYVPTRQFIYLTNGRWIFSKNSSSWGSYYYNEKEDALRVKVKPVALDKSVEWLKYEFLNQTENSATIALSWEKLMIPFKIEVDYIKAQLASFRNELRTEKGFIWQSWEQAANWCLQRNVNLEEALLWADSATSTGFDGAKSFRAASTKAQLLDKLGRSNDAMAVMKVALPNASMNEIHQYGRTLLAQKKSKEALEIFKSNYQKNPNQFTTLMGLVRGYSANGDYKTALDYANKALVVAPDTNNKNNVTAMIDKLKAGKDVN